MAIVTVAENSKVLADVDHYFYTKYLVDCDLLEYEYDKESYDGVAYSRLDDPEHCVITRFAGKVLRVCEGQGDLQIPSSKYKVAYVWNDRRKLVDAVYLEAGMTCEVDATRSVKAAYRAYRLEQDAKGMGLAYEQARKLRSALSDKEYEAVKQLMYEYKGTKHSIADSFRQSLAQQVDCWLFYNNVRPCPLSPKQLKCLCG